MGRLTLLTLCFVLIVIEARAQTTAYDLVYDASLGTLSIQNGGPISTYLIQGGPFVFENLIDPLEHSFITTANFVELSSTDFTIPTILNANLGQVLEIGLSQNQLETRIQRATYNAGFGNPLIDFDLIYLERTSPLGDFNNDGTVDAADYTVWRNGLGTTYTAADYRLWQNNYGATSAGLNSVTTPEPAALVLAALASVGLVERKKR